MQTPSWPTAEQLALAKPIVPIVPKVQGRREFLPRLDEKTHFFIVPCKRIHNQSLMETWMASEAYVRLIDFLQSLNESVFNVSVSDGQTKPRSRIVLEILTMFDTMDSWIEEIPLDTSSVSRFGNVAFRIWIEKLNQVR
jgi:serine/threonine-protein phosphatase 2A activator